MVSVGGWICVVVYFWCEFWVQCGGLVFRFVGYLVLVVLWAAWWCFDFLVVLLFYVVGVGGFWFEYGFVGFGGLVVGWVCWLIWGLCCLRVLWRLRFVCLLAFRFPAELCLGWVGVVWFLWVLCGI